MERNSVPLEGDAGAEATLAVAAITESSQVSARRENEPQPPVEEEESTEDLSDGVIEIYLDEDVLSLDLGTAPWPEGGLVERPRPPLLSSLQDWQQPSTKRRRVQRLVERQCFSRVPSTLEETEIGGVEAYDKIFAAEWLEKDVVVMGTKDNKLVRWDLSNGRRVDITLPDCSAASFMNPDHCGIHTISINPSRTLLATGGTNPNDAVVFNLPSFEPVKQFVGHTDWLFASAWVTDAVLVTGSRDRGIRLWSMDGDDFEAKSQMTRVGHSQRVRDLKYARSVERAEGVDWRSLSQILSSLSHDGTLKLWEPRFLTATCVVKLRYTEDLFCMAAGDPLLHGHSLMAVGSRYHVSLIDPRAGAAVHHISQGYAADGVRSLAFRHNILTSGTGSGRITFFDLRVGQFLELCRDPIPGALVETPILGEPAVSTPNQVSAAVDAASEPPFAAVETTEAVDPVAADRQTAIGAIVSAIRAVPAPERLGPGEIIMRRARRLQRSLMGIPARPYPDANGARTNPARCTGKGWLDPASPGLVHNGQVFRERHVDNAVYAHSFDESGTRLLAAGGPLMVDLRGSYLAVWS